MEIFAKQFEQASNSEQYTEEFLNNKSTSEIVLDLSTEETESYNGDFTMVELEEALTDTKDTSPGPDRIPYEILKQLPGTYKEKMLKLFNLIWRQGTYPSQWREALVIPIPKQGKDLKLPSSYRPISLTCCLSKVLEKMINNRLTWVLESRNLLSNIQTGFRKNRSTTDQLVLLEQAIKNALAIRKHLIAVFF